MDPEEIMDVSDPTPEETVAQSVETASPAERPQVTFQGNSYDLTSVAAVIAAFFLLFLCLSCNMGFYCLPFIPLVLGVIGLIAAKSSVNVERTRLFSWIGVGAGGLTLLLLTLAVVGYFALVVLVIVAESANW